MPQQHILSYIEMDHFVIPTNFVSDENLGWRHPQSIILSLSNGPLTRPSSEAVEPTELWAASFYLEFLPPLRVSSNHSSSQRLFFLFQNIVQTQMLTYIHVHSPL
jgi:hypothetical protein